MTNTWHLSPEQIVAVLVPQIQEQIVAFLSGLRRRSWISRYDSGRTTGIGMVSFAGVPHTVRTLCRRTMGVVMGSCDVVSPTVPHLSFRS